MGRLLQILICVSVLAAITLPLEAQEDAATVKRKAQNKLLALRAARVDAIRKLAERIKGLMINSETSVRDFVTEYDEINSSLMAFLNGMREKGKPRFHEDGTCEVTVQVKLRKTILNLQQSYKRYYKGDKVKIEDFQKMSITHKDTILTETGSGAPRSEEWEKGIEMAVVKEGMLTSPRHMSAAAKAFWMQYCTGQGRLMAVRAARTDAQRRLAERIRGVFINAETTVRDFVAESDQVDVSMETFMRGFRETGIRYHQDELIVEVELTVKLRTVYASLKSWGQRHYKGDKVKITQLDKLVITVKDRLIKETGMGVPPERYLKDATAVIIETVRRGPNIPPWLSQRLRAVGNAALDTENENLAQAKLMAYRAAELDARRKLAEEIDGLMITSNTSVRDFITQNDEIETAMLTFQQGAHRKKGSEKLLDDGTAQVTVEIDLRPLWNMIVYYQKRLTIVIK